MLSPNFFVEALLEPQPEFVNSGATSPTSIDGTLLVDVARNSRYWAPTFCGVCGATRSATTRTSLLKGTYFLSTAGTGSHNLAFGYDYFNDKRLANNHQSGSDYRILGTTTIIRDRPLVGYPAVPRRRTHHPVEPDPASAGSNFRTHSLFFNDTWRVTDRLTVNLGLRCDKNDGAGSGSHGHHIEYAWSPRLGFVFDPTVMTGGP